jgi:prolyl oligopeptidase
MVPLTVLHRNDAVADRGHRAFIEGYGAYGNSQQPSFDATTLEWVKAGNIYAVAKVRGGGENGDQWRVAGSKMGKRRSIEDFIGCARALVASGWTTPSRITAFGGSAGGILVGGAIVRAPTQFGAAVIQSGMLDTARLAVAKNGADQFAEFGDARTAEGMKSLVAMDAYLHVHSGVKYPAVLLVVGLNDSRVAPWMSGKFGARLLAAHPDPRPVWFRTDSDMGHFNTALGSTSLEFADAFAFAEAMTP